MEVCCRNRVTLEPQTLYPTSPIFGLPPVSNGSFLQLSVTESLATQESQLTFAQPSAESYLQHNGIHVGPLQAVVSVMFN